MTVQFGVLAQRSGWGWDGYATAHRPNWQSQRTYEDFGSGSQGPQVVPQVLSGLAQNCVCPEEGVLFLILMETLKSPWLAVRWGLDPDTDPSSLGRQSWYKHTELSEGMSRVGEALGTGP